MRGWVVVWSLGVIRLPRCARKDTDFGELIRLFKFNLFEVVHRRSFILLENEFVQYIPKTLSALSVSA